MKTVCFPLLRFFSQETDSNNPTYVFSRVSEGISTSQTAFGFAKILYQRLLIKGTDFSIKSNA